MARQEKMQKIEELNSKLATLKEQKRKLDVEAGEFAEKRNTLNEALKNLKTEISKLKNARDKINEQVKELKNQRSQLKAEMAQKTDELKSLTKELEALTMKKPPKSFKELKNEAEAIEWKIQTTPTDLQAEKQLVEHAKQVEAQLVIHRKIDQLSQKRLELKAELKALGARIKVCHENVAENAKKSQELHQEMLKKVEEAKKLKAEADNFHKCFVQAKEDGKKLQKEIDEILDEIRQLKREIQAEEDAEKLKDQEAILETVEKQALEKLKRGEKLTWEEFKILAEKGIA
ncbi:hypothetical protein KEJ45_04220 [Candidatus Bathyarchaeota archaeon]|nr:hypothetical protein [Candidatus Bathyarchaeota archaeon]